jgi:hypothetical protein
MTPQHQTRHPLPRRWRRSRPFPAGEAHAEMVHRHDMRVTRYCQETVRGVRVDPPGREGELEDEGFAGWVLGKVECCVARVVCGDEDFFTGYFADAHVCNGIWLANVNTRGSIIMGCFFGGVRIGRVGIPFGHRLQRVWEWYLQRRVRQNGLSPLACSRCGFYLRLRCRVWAYAVRQRGGSFCGRRHRSRGSA